MGHSNFYDGMVRENVRLKDKINEVLYAVKNIKKRKEKGLGKEAKWEKEFVATLVFSLGFEWNIRIFLSKILLPFLLSS